MSVTIAISAAAGLLAAIGLTGILLGAAARRPMLRRRSFAIGSGSMTVAGLVLLIAGIVGSTHDEIFGGLMLLLFGTGVSLPARAPHAATS